MDKEYWGKRFEYLEKLQIVNEEKYIEKLAEQYTVALERIKKEINNWFTRFAVNNQISLRESKKWLNTSELKELQWDIKEYIRHGEENGIDLIWKKELENASAKVHISRLNALMLQIQERLEELYGQQNNSLSEYIIDTYKDTYYNSAYALQSGFNVAFNISAIDESIITKLILNPWTADGMTFSDRIWRNKKELIYTLQTELTQAIIRGDGLENVINKIAKKFNAEKNKAGRLVMTETAFFSSQARKQCFNDLWVKKYEIVATLDSHTSQICRGLDGKVFNMKDYSVGITAPPFHVWCRSTTAPYFNDEFEFGERAARNTDGKTYYIPSNIKYNDWYNEYINNEKYDIDIDKEKLQKKVNNVKIKTREEKVQELQNIIIDMNEARRKHWNLNMVTKEEMITSPFKDLTYSVDLEGIDEKIVDTIIEDYKNLGSEYYTTLCHIGTFDENDLKVRPNSGGYANVAVKTLTGEIHFNQTVLGDFDNYVETMKRCSQIKHIPATINPENYKYYVSTHEFAHTIFNSAMKDKNLIGMDNKIYKDFDKELEKKFEKYKNRIKELDDKIHELDLKFIMGKEKFTTEDHKLLKKLKKEKEEIFVSNYAKRDNSKDEFMAECFAQARLSDNPSKTSLDVMELINKYFKR